MFKVEILQAEDTFTEKYGIVSAVGHGMAKTIAKARKEALRMVQAALYRKTDGWGACPILEQTTITHIGNGKVTVEF